MERLNQRQALGGLRRGLRIECLETRQLLAAGVNLAVYEFTNHTSTTPELFSTDTHPETTASDITSPLSLGSTGNGDPPRGLALGGAFNETSEPTPAGGQNDYFQFTVTPDAGYLMNTSRMSMQIRRNDPDSKNSYAVYFDEDPGPAGDNFATKLISGAIASEDVFETVVVDVEGMSPFTNQTTALTFRVYVWGTVGLGTMRLDNIRVQAVQSTSAGSTLAYYGDSGRLLHPPDALGNRIPDFSTAGYRNGNTPVPDVANTIDASRIVNVAPALGDDMVTIQNAIDQVAAMTPDANGFRGIVQLGAGEFQINDQLTILDSGVVLRGVGDGDDPATSTILRGTGTQQRSLVVVGRSSGFASGIANTTHNIVDKYVPVGATSLLVDSTANWSVGDPVVVKRPSTAEWISAIGMDMIPPRSDGGTVVQWAPGGNFDQLYERVITRIEGDRIFLNAPLMNSFDQQYGGGTVFRYTFPRINNVGIENLRGISDFVGPEDEAHARSFIELQAVEDAWVTNVTGQHFIYATVHATSRAMRVTVDDAQSLDPVSIITGGRRYPFTIDGQFVLMKNLYSEQGRHDFVNNSSWRNRGPNVFLNGTAVNAHSSTGPHQRWSTGTLYDTISTDNITEGRNRGNFGSGHGWAGANMVFWNNTATQYIVQNPPTAQNWLIGSSGAIVDETRFGPQPPATVDAHETPIDFADPDNPLNSLYVAQHNQRTALPLLEQRQYVLGDFDRTQFDGAASADDVPVDPQWLAEVTALASGQPIESLDQLSDGHYVPLSFSYLLDDDQIVHAATVSLGLRGTGGNTLDDTMWLEDVADGRTFASLGLTSPLSTSETTPVLIELMGADLTALQDGLLNLLVGQNTAVDWAILDLHVATLETFDLGDAPSPYPTLRSDDGARHAAIGPRLGDARDEETDGQPSANAGGDGDDEDGVMFGGIYAGNAMAGVNIDLQNADQARVDAWLDFDGNGIWDASDQILDDVQVFAGLQTLNFTIPSDAVVGQTFARVRVSSVGDLPPAGFSFDGEVEDDSLEILSMTPAVQDVVINRGDPQRSSLTEVSVTFDREVTAPDSAFTIRDRHSDVPVDSLLVTSSVADGKTVSVLTFGPGDLVVTRGSGPNTLVDGNYRLEIDAAQIETIGGGPNMADDFTFGDQPMDAFFRKYGDQNGNQLVDLLDFAEFRRVFGTSQSDPGFNEGLNSDADNLIGLLDFAAFRRNFGT